MVQFWYDFHGYNIDALDVHRQRADVRSVPAAQGERSGKRDIAGFRHGKGDGGRYSCPVKSQIEVPGCVGVRCERLSVACERDGRFWNTAAAPIGDDAGQGVVYRRSRT